MVPIKEQYRAGVEYRSYRVIHKLLCSDEDIASDIYSMRKKIVVQMTDDIDTIAARLMIKDIESSTFHARVS